MRPTALGLLALLALAPATLAASPAPVGVIAVDSRATPHERVLVLRGRTAADRRVEVRAEVGGLVVSEPVRRGTVVAAGDLLCRIDEGERPAALAEARAAMTQAEADFAAAERLAERGFTAQTEALNRSAKLEAARARVMRAELDLARLIMTAPFDGVLEEDTAQTGTLLQPGGLCATVTALDPIIMTGYVAEREVDRLSVGMPATAQLVTGRMAEGAVRFVARSAESATRTFRVEIAVPNPDLAIRDGISADIAVRLDAVKAHRLPQSALTLGDDGAIGVRVVEAGAARFLPVRIIDDGPAGVWVTGLPDAAQVIVVGQEFVADGTPVAVSAPSAPEARP